MQSLSFLFYILCLVPLAFLQDLSGSSQEVLVCLPRQSSPVFHLDSLVEVFVAYSCWSCAWKSCPLAEDLASEVLRPQALGSKGIPHVSFTVNCVAQMQLWGELICSFLILLPFKAEWLPDCQSKTVVCPYSSLHRVCCFARNIYKNRYFYK